MSEDTTCINCLRIIKGHHSSNRKYCNNKCYTNNKRLNNLIKKAENNIIKERDKWKTTTPDMYRMFYEIIWYLKKCDLCGDKLNNQIHLKIRSDININHINEDSFQILCSSCYMKVNKLIFNGLINS